MGSRCTKYLIVFALSMYSIVAVALPAYARQTKVTGDISLSELRVGEIYLRGSNDSADVLFHLPADWRITGDVSFELHMTVSLGGRQNEAAARLGTLKVILNGETVSVLPLAREGEAVETLEVPEEFLPAAQSDGRMNLSFALSRTDSCDDQTSVTIHPSSHFSLEHAYVLPDTSLINFPRPIFQDSIGQDSALIVIPDQPSAAELQSALTVAAGLGRLTHNRLLLDLTPLGQLTSEQMTGHHLILVGTPASLPILSQLHLPMPTNVDEFLMPDRYEFEHTQPDDGVIQLFNSPWSDKHAILVVAGASDAGTVKAAQAVSTGKLRANVLANVAIVKQVQNSPEPVPAGERTLADLGYDRQLFQTRGAHAASYDFYLPPNAPVARGSFVEIAFSHSASLDFNASAIGVLLNSQPIGDVPLSGESANRAVVQKQMTIPSGVLRPGNNTLEIRANLQPIDPCADPDQGGLWMTILPESRFHLLPGSTQDDLVAPLDLDAYPSPFVFDPTLGSTAFVLQRDQWETWRVTVHIASYLGERAKGPIVTLRAFYGNEPLDGEWRAYNLLIVGRASQIPIVSAMKDAMPAPFAFSDLPTENSLWVTFRTTFADPVGYLELLPSPWESHRVVLTALGNTLQGVKWAASTLYDSPARSGLAGNLAVINDTQLLTTDTRLNLLGQPSRTDDAANASLLQSTSVPAVVLLALLAIVIIPALFIAFRRRRLHNQ